MPSKTIVRIFRGIGRPQVLVSLLMVLVCSVLTLVNPSILDEYLEALLVDYRFKIRNRVFGSPVLEDVVIVAIDEKSLSTHGRWPWNRGLQSALMERILQGEPRVLAVDIFYPEAESVESDRLLASVFSRHREKVIVALGFEVVQGRDYTGEIPEPLYDSVVARVEHFSDIRPVNANRVMLPPEPLDESANFGHVYSLPDRDGKLRWETLYLRYGEEYVPSLALQAACIALGESLDRVRIVGGLGVRVGDTFVPTDTFGRIPINYYGREKSLPYVSAADVLSGRTSRERFRDKIVFLGTSAIATYDLKNTPFSANMPGVEKNATVLANLLQGDVMQRAPIVLDLLVVFFMGCFVVFTGTRFRALRTVILYLLVAVLFVLLNLLVFSLFRIRMNLFYPLVLIFTGGGFTVSYRYLVEERSAREVRRIFSNYVTERVVNELIKNPELAKLGGERREITVLFSDIRGFTSYSEKNAPEVVVSMLNEFLEAMTGVIFRWEGTLDKFVGDEIMAFWGAPLIQKNHAELAVRCALNMIDKLSELQETWRAEGKVPLDIGIGINSGEVLVGNIGAEGKKMDYTIIGDHVNLGARIESLTRVYDTHILMSEFTLEKIRGLVLSGNLGHSAIKGMERVTVKGREEPVGLYELRALEHGEESILTEVVESETGTENSSR